MRNVAIYIIGFILTAIVSTIIKNEILVNELYHMFPQEEIRNFRIVNYSSVGVEVIISMSVLMLVFAIAYFLYAIFHDKSWVEGEGNLKKILQGNHPIFL